MNIPQSPRTYVKRRYLGSKISRQEIRISLNEIVRSITDIVGILKFENVLRQQMNWEISLKNDLIFQT